MEQRAKVIIVALVVVIVILAGSLIAELSSTDGGGTSATGMGMGMGMGMGGADAYMGMMQAMGNMNSDAMLANMRTALGEDGYRRMLDHWRTHRAGGPTGNADIDETMHRMMDSMMERMPAARDQVPPLPKSPSSASPTGTPAR